MPMAPPRACPRGHLVREPGPCPICTKARDKARGSASARQYDYAWAIYSKAWLARYPWCGQRQDGTLHAEHSRCVRSGHRLRADVTDHIVSLRDGGAKMDPANHQSLCVGCNTAKDARRRDG